MKFANNIHSMAQSKRQKYILAQRSQSAVPCWTSSENPVISSSPYRTASCWKLANYLNTTALAWFFCSGTQIYSRHPLLVTYVHVDETADGTRHGCSFWLQVSLDWAGQRIELAHAHLHFVPEHTLFLFVCSLNRTQEQTEPHQNLWWW